MLSNLWFCERTWSSKHMLSSRTVHNRRTEINWTDLYQVDPVTRRVIGHARQCHEVDWLRGSALQFSTVQFVCCEHGFSLFTLRHNDTHTISTDRCPARRRLITRDANVGLCGISDIRSSPYTRLQWRGQKFARVLCFSIQCADFLIGWSSH